MRSCREMRQDAWNLMMKSPWGWRVFGSQVLLGLVLIAALVAVATLYDQSGITTWQSFQDAVNEAKRSGIALAAPTAGEAFRMTVASAFQTFVELLFSGIVSFGLASVLVRALSDDGGGWLGAAFGGFKKPFHVFWLYTRMMIQIYLWMLLLVIPGIMAAFRYALTWYVKAENPEFGARECLKESGRLMEGRKGALFVLGLSYFGWLLLPFLPLFAGMRFSASGNLAAGLPLLFIGVVFAVWVAIYQTLGIAVFYRDAKREAAAGFETI